MSHSYPSDISRGSPILPVLESARRRTKPRTVDLYDVFCGVLTSRQWRIARGLPQLAHLPPVRQWSERPGPAKDSGDVAPVW